MISGANRGIIDAYTGGVLDGTRVAGALEIAAVRRHLDDMETGGDRGLYFSEWHAELALSWFPLCKHSKGKFAGHVFELAPWQMFLIWQLYGWRRSGDDTRRFRKVLIEVARKNGKSTFAAAIALKQLLADTPAEHCAEVYCIATRELQARIIFDEAKRMRAQSSCIAELTTATAKHIEARDGGKFVPLVGNPEAQSGNNASCTIIDELHAWGDVKHRETWEQVNTAGGSREQPLVIITTTAGSTASMLWLEERKLAQRVVECGAEGEHILDSYLVYIACIDVDDEPLDPTVWPKANPNLGISVNPDYLAEQADEARQSPAKLNQFIRYHGNRIVTPFAQAISPTMWARALDADWQPEPGATCHGGLDLGRSDDFSAFALLFPDGDEYHLRVWAWTCAERSKEMRTADVAGWIHEGYLIEHPGDAVDFSEIEAFISGKCDQYNVQSMAFDEQFARELAQRLTDRHGVATVKFFQTPRNYNEPTRTFIKRLGSDTRPSEIKHNGNPCLSWQAGNVNIKRNAKDEWMPDKGGEKWQKIDGMVASIMAYSEALFSETQPACDWYANNDLEAI